MATMVSVPFFCKEIRAEQFEPCGHPACESEPAYRVDYETLICLASTCSNRGLALHAEMTLRKRYPSDSRPTEGK